MAAPALSLSMPIIRTRSVAARAGLVVFVGILGFLVVMPLWRLQQLALDSDAAGYHRAFGRPGVGSTIWTTVLLAVGSLVIALVLGTFLAWCASRLPPGMRLLRMLPVLPIVVPAVAAVIGWGFLFSPRPGYLNGLLRQLPWWSHLDKGPVDVYTLPWIILITGFGLTAFVYLFVNSGFSNINSELIEAAEVSGSSSIGAFFRVTLPLLRPVLVYGGGVALLLGLGQFTAPLLLGRQSGVSVLTTDMYAAVAQSPVDYASAAAIGSPLLGFGVLIVLMQRVILGDHTRFVTHAGKSFRARGRRSRGSAAALIAYGVLSIALPIASLVILSLSKFWSPKIDPSAFTLDNFRTVLETNGITSAILMSLTSSLVAVAICIPVGFVAASVLLRAKRLRIFRWLIDFLISLPLGVPAVVFGVGFLLAYTKEPFLLYGTRWVIILVYVTLMLPFTTRMQLSAMVALGESYEEAARVSGAGPVRTAVQVIVPMTRGTIAGASALMFVLLTHEFAASVLVRSPLNQVMGTVLFDYYVNGSYPTVAAIALIMTAVTATGVAVAMISGGSEVFDKM
jgi:iron(III) transport system permease protein